MHARVHKVGPHRWPCFHLTLDGVVGDVTSSSTRAISSAAHFKSVTVWRWKGCRRALRWLTRDWWTALGPPPFTRDNLHGQNSVQKAKHLVV